MSASLGLLLAILRRELGRGRQGVILVVGDSDSLLPEGETEYSLYIGIAVLILAGLLEPVDLGARPQSTLRGESSSSDS